MFGNIAADATYHFPLNFHAKELAHNFEVAHMWDTCRERDDSNHNTTMEHKLIHHCIGEYSCFSSLVHSK